SNGPIAPTGLVASAASSSEIDLTWQDNSSNETGFKIQRAASSTGPWTQIATVGAGVTSYANTGLSPATTYYYQVAAYNLRSTSIYAGPAGATTLSLCSFTLSPPGATPSELANSGTVTVTASGSTCAWSATSSATAWLTCSPPSGTGSGTVTWSVT